VSLWQCLDCEAVLDGGSVPPSICVCTATLGGWRWKGPSPDQLRPKGQKGCAWECQGCGQTYAQRRCPAYCSNCNHRKGYKPRWRELKGANDPRRKRIGTVTPSNRELVFARDEYRCVICGNDDRKALTLDHIRPKSKGGGNDLKNLQTLCRDCNGLKADIVPPPGETYPPQLLAA